MPDGMRLISLNTRGISNFQKRRMIFTWCRKKGADVILQETYSKKEIELQWRNEWGTEMILARGVAILLNKVCRLLHSAEDH